jgi:hypothetical protein
VFTYKTPFAAATMCRACPIPSANTEAQNPAGSFNPLSSLGHPWLAAAISLLAWLRSATRDPKTHNGTITAIKERRVLYLRNHPIEVLQSKRTNTAVGAVAADAN